MNTTDYFTNINAMFLFCIFICLLLLAVGWQLVRKADKLKKEQDSHLKATNTNALLNKALSAKNAALQANEHKLRDAEKEIRDLQAKLDHAENDRIELRAERATLENKLTDALVKVRKRDKDGKFLPSGNVRVRTPKKVEKKPNSNGLALNHAYIDEATGVQTESALNMGRTLNLAKDKSPKLSHGLTVKNPTEGEAKMIFDEARRFGVAIYHEDMSTGCNMIWYYGNAPKCERGITGDSFKANDKVEREYVTAKAFVQRMQNGRV